MILADVDVQDDDELMGDGDLMLMLMFDLVLACYSSGVVYAFSQAEHRYITFFFFLEIYLFSHLTKYDDCHEKEIEKENISLLQLCNVERRRFSLPSDILTLHDLLCHPFVCVI